MEVIFHGVRGSTPTAHGPFLKCGGNIQKARTSGGAQIISPPFVFDLFMNRRSQKCSLSLQDTRIRASTAHQSAPAPHLTMCASFPKVKRGAHYEVLRRLFWHFFFLIYYEPFWVSSVAAWVLNAPMNVAAGAP